MSNEINKLVQEVFFDLANALETGELKPKIKIGLTHDGSEHSHSVMLEAASIAKSKGLFEVVFIGSKIETDIELIEANGEKEVQAKLEELLDNDYIQGCVTLHYSFPIGVSTVGKVITPAQGKPMYIANTTGTTSNIRNEAMVLNAIGGIITAKVEGNANPSVGILNVDGASSVKRALEQLKENGYPINFGSSKRADGGIIMRGNDLLMGSVDVMVCDALTGNILMKMFSSFNTGGSYEAVGFGYGPGIGEGYNRNICIISRASGAAVIANALEYCASVARGNFKKIAAEEYALANKAKLSDIRASLQPKAPTTTEEIKKPDKEPLTGEISGIDVLDLDDAVSVLWKANIYAESGAGCTGPIIKINEAKHEIAIAALKEAGYQ